MLSFSSLLLALLGVHLISSSVGVRVSPERNVRVEHPLVKLTAPVRGSQFCDPAYECEFRYVDSNNKIWYWDLRPLCSQADYFVNDTQHKQLYYFNICGQTQHECIPEWKTPFQSGNAMQFFGNPPDCKVQKCNNTLTGEMGCCTSPCQTLGNGAPVYKPSDYNNPKSGGLQIKHFSIPPM